MNAILSFLGEFESFDLFQMKGERNEAKENILYRGGGETNFFFLRRLRVHQCRFFPEAKQTIKYTSPAHEKHI